MKTSPPAIAERIYALDPPEVTPREDGIVRMLLTAYDDELSGERVEFGEVVMTPCRSTKDNRNIMPIPYSRTLDTFRVTALVGGKPIHEITVDPFGSLITLEPLETVRVIQRAQAIQADASRLVMLHCGLEEIPDGR